MNYTFWRLQTLLLFWPYSSSRFFMVTQYDTKWCKCCACKTTEIVKKSNIWKSLPDKIDEDDENDKACSNGCACGRNGHNFVIWKKKVLLLSKLDKKYQNDVLGSFKKFIP